MRITLSARIRSLFARDKYSFWWSEITNEEKELARMDVWQLAATMQDQSSQQRRIVAEHMLGVRLANIQASASKWAGWLSLVGAVLASLVSFYLGHESANKPREVVCNCNCEHQQNEVQRPTQVPGPSAIRPNAPDGPMKKR